MYRYIILIILLSLAGPLYAADSTVDAFYELGRKGSSGLVEEEDLIDEFYYSKYSLKFAQEFKPHSSYYIKYQYYDKDFDNLSNLDNHFHDSSISIDTLLFSEDDFTIRTGPDFEYKTKLYPDSKASEYDQIKFDIPVTFKKEGDYTVRLTGGLNSFHYPGAPKDELKINSKLEVSKKFFEERLDLSAFYRFQYVARERIADRYERTYGASADIKIGSSLIRSFEAGLEEGMDNTIIYEEREDSYDYKFLAWYLKTRHSFGDRVRSSVKYTDIKRVYADFDHNYDGFVIENSWDLKALEIGDTSFDLRLTYLHKQFRYPYVSSPYAFHNNNIYSGASITRKDDWKAAIDSEVRFYDYPARRTNDKIYYIGKAGIEKYLLGRDLVLACDYRHTFKNFLHKPDIVENAVRVSARVKF